MKIKVAEASDFVLDWLVLQTLDLKDVLVAHGDISFALYPGVRKYFRPSTDPVQAYPLIERACIATSPMPDGTWRGYAPKGVRIMHGRELYNWVFKAVGPTVLIAAMRCYVASKLGDEVEVPDELVEA
jgi:hypothetical protein